ncbi:hypothetical protein GBA52_005750 [Prunus armeniaca]|nr:hypothetical protein GBA52_005750 [Prunus armeniaca]
MTSILTKVKKCLLIICRKWVDIKREAWKGSIPGEMGYNHYINDGRGETTFTISMDWENSMGSSEALLVKNHHHSQFYLKTITLENVPEHGRLHFVCNSWVYPARYYKYNRIFFPNKAYLPLETPPLLLPYREEELKNLRGSGSRKLKEWDRVYDYTTYNDLGSPDDLVQNMHALYLVDRSVHIQEEEKQGENQLRLTPILRADWHY